MDREKRKHSFSTNRAKTPALVARVVDQSKTHVRAKSRPPAGVLAKAVAATEDAEKAERLERKTQRRTREDRQRGPGKKEAAKSSS